ncbi:MAG: DNA (cytosine-5-)-methyltransferase, partial [Bacteroidota bacterium]
MKVISLFSGAGGMDIGFEQAGFEIVLAVEKDLACCNTLKKNKPDLNVLQGDVSELTGKEILNLANLKRTEAAMVIGGPPCQSFSLAGKRKGMDDERGKLVLEFARLVKEILPVAFVMENVKGMVNWNNGAAIQEIIASFETKIPYQGLDYSYSVKNEVLNGANFGLPQFRERLFLVGNRVGVKYSFPKPTHGPNSGLNLFDDLKEYNSVWDAIGHLPPAQE